MSKKAGSLLLNRMRLTITGAGLAVDTGITQANLGTGSSSDGEPTLAERLMVMVMAPTAAWANITHTAPVYDATTGTIHVTFANSGATAAINVLFWDPSTLVGPVEVDAYV